MKLPGPLVSPEWLTAHLTDVQIVDVSWSIDDGPKVSDYLSGHIPGAVFANLDTDLSDQPGARGRHPLPTATAFAVARSRLGLDGRPVVAYDDNRGAVAARLWWMLDSIGIQAAVLDGGIDAWTGQLESGEVIPAPAETIPIPWPTECFVPLDEVLNTISQGVVWLDARSADRFTGRPNRIDARPGHIPGTKSRPWTDNVGENGRLHSPERLSDEFIKLGVTADCDLVASCGSGVTGCHDLLAARVCGIKAGRLYTGSWSEWCKDPNRPIAIED